MKTIMIPIILSIAGCYTNSDREKVSSAPLPADYSPEQGPYIASEVEEQFSLWTEFLRKVVHADGGISFKAIEENRETLSRFVTWVGRSGPKRYPDQFPTMEMKKAFYINAYNANAMYLAFNLGLHENKLSYLYKWRRIKFYSQETISVDGDVQTLTDFENKVIRPLGDARVHFMLNCLAVGCPRLLPEAVPFQNYEVFAEARAMEFFNSTKHCQVIAKKKRVEFSKIMDWYADDFKVGGQSLIQFANRYRTEKIPENYDVEYLDYDWNLNNLD